MKWALLLFPLVSLVLGQNEVTEVFNNIEYIHLSQTFTFDNAVAACLAFNASLVKPVDADTLEFIHNFAQSQVNNDIWINFREIDDTTDGSLPQSYGIEENGFGAVRSEFPWRSGQPRNDGARCVAHRIPENHWDDLGCGGSRRIVCERSLQPNEEVVSVFKGNEIIYIPEQVNFDTAISKCNNLGAQLVQIQDEETFNFVANFSASQGESDIWINYKQVNDTLDPTLPSSYGISSVFGNISGVFPWASDQPADNGEFCVSQRLAENDWTNVECNFRLRIPVCQRAIESEEDELNIIPLSVLSAAVVLLLIASALLVNEQRGLKRLRIREKATNKFYDKVVNDNSQILVKNI